MNRSIRNIAIAATLVAGLAAPATGQDTSIALETHFLGYSFDDGLGPDVANIILFPVAYRSELSDLLTVDVYTAWGRGQVEQDEVVYSLSGIVDSRIRLNYRAREWANVNVSLNLPTGNSSHTAEESVVASVLSSDLLGFRESTWGSGFGLTTGVATAGRLGSWGLGFGASYRLASEFEPVADSTLGYSPGNEIRVRAGVDRSVGESGSFSAGVTYQNFSDDQLDGRNLFQAGNRVSVDASYAFRAGASTWSLYLTDVWRENGDLFLDLIDGSGVIVGDTTLTTASQNLIAGALSGAIPIGTGYRLRPTVEARVQSREEVDGTRAGSGWMLGVGADFRIRVLGAYDLFPALKYVTGRIDGSDGIRRGANGVSATMTLRWRF